MPTFAAVNEAHGMIGSEFSASMKSELANISIVERNPSTISIFQLNLASNFQSMTQIV